MTKKTAKRTPQHPVLFPPKPRARPEPAPSLMRRVAPILERTKRARAELDRIAAQADMMGLMHLDVVVFPNGRPKLPGLRRRLNGGSKRRSKTAVTAESLAA